MPNSLAYLMLMAWPAMAVALFRLVPFERALIWSILAPYLLLPPKTSLDLPMIPPLDKVSIPNLVAVACCVLLCRRKLNLRPASLVATLLLAMFVISPFATVLTNAEPAFFGSLMLPGLRVYDAVSAIANQLIFLIPFFLARQFLATDAAQKELLIALMIAGLAYSVPMLIEVRFSPQLNTWIYGFFQHDFEQMVREGGYRPIVFLQHGLLVAFLAMTSFIAAVALARAADLDSRTPLVLEAAYLAILLVLCKTLGALIFAVCLLPLVLFASRKSQLRIAALLAVLAFSYPLMRGADLVPVDTMLEQAGRVEADRARSLGVRFDNEAVLLDRASEKPAFGWGGWGRNRVYTDYGQDIVITDGRWIIIIGVYGWSGYIAEFGLIALPLILLALRTRRSDPAEIPPWTGALALLLGANMIDLIPNSSLTPLTWLMGGALLGYAEHWRARDLAAREVVSARRPQLLDGIGSPRPALDAPEPGKRRTIL